MSAGGRPHGASVDVVCGGVLGGTGKVADILCWMFLMENLRAAEVFECNFNLHTCLRLLYCIRWVVADLNKGCVCPRAVAASRASAAVGVISRVSVAPQLSSERHG